MRNLGEKSNSVSDLRLIDCTSDFCQKRAWQCKSKIKIEILVFKKKKKKIRHGKWGRNIWHPRAQI